MMAIFYGGGKREERNRLRETEKYCSDIAMNFPMIPLERFISNQYGAAIAEWIRLRLQSYGCRFYSQSSAYIKTKPRVKLEK